MTSPPRARIVVIHEDPPVAREASERLREFGYDVIGVAPSREEASSALLALRERKAELNERLAALGTLAAGVTREFEKPLSFVIGSQQHALRELSALRELLDGLEPKRRALALELSNEIACALRDASTGADSVRALVSKLQALSHPNPAQHERFDVRSALDGAPARAPSSPRAAASRLDLCARLLLVDDEPILLDALTRALEEHYAIDRAAGGQAALDLMALGNEYDLVLCDLMMPDMTGMDLFRELERRFPIAARRTAFMTGGAFTLSAREFISRPGLRVLEKPFTNSELFTFIAACLGAFDLRQRADVS